ncbi:MAG: hypothetical protein ACLSG5_04035 [Oscillospiraceae bacterium]
MGGETRLNPAVQNIRSGGETVINPALGIAGASVGTLFSRAATRSSAGLTSRRGSGYFPLQEGRSGLCREALPPSDSGKRRGPGGAGGS